MERELTRLHQAHLKNLEYLQKKDEQRLEQLQSKRPRSEYKDSSQPKAKKSNTNVAIYVNGLTTYIACKQLEGLAAKIGRVKRIKFYKDDQGRLKGDGLIVFHYGDLDLLIQQLDGIEIKPGIFMSASPAQFNAKPQDPNSKPDSSDENKQTTGLQFNLKVGANTEVESSLKTRCKEFGEIANWSSAPDSGLLLVHFREHESASKCLAVLNASVIHGHKLSVEYSDHPITSDEKQPALPAKDEAKVQEFLFSVAASATQTQEKEQVQEDADEAKLQAFLSSF